MYATLTSLRESILGEKRTSALLMLTAVGAFLLLSCANVASLLVTRASVRPRGLAVRAALGAGSRELARHAGLEALILALVSTATGLAMASGLIQAANHFYASELEYAPAHLDARVLVALAALAIVSTLAIGLAPTLYALRVRPMDSLRADGRSSSSRAARRLREGLVAAQVAITLALVVSASVLVRSIRELHAVAPGFDPRVVAAHVSTPPSLRGSPDRIAAFARTVLERTQRAPGVAAAAIVSDVPFDDNALSYTTENGPGALKDNVDSLIHYVSPEAFDVLRIPLLAGRPFTAADSGEGVRVAAVSQAFAVQYLGTERAVGRHFSFGEREGDKPDGEKLWYEIVAVAGDVLDGVVTEPAKPTIYLPYSPSNPFGGITVVARGPLTDAGLEESIVRVVRDADPGATVLASETWARSPEVVSRAHRPRATPQPRFAIPTR